MNLIITCPRNLERDTKNEITRILNELGDDSPSIFITNMPGIITVDTDVETEKVINEIKIKIQDEPWAIRYILRAIPIQKTISTDINDIVNGCAKFRESIKDDETYRITIEKRNSEISSSEIISKVAEKIQKKVSLEKPTWSVLVEILGEKTGLSLIHSGDIVSVEKLKRAISE